MNNVIVNCNITECHDKFLQILNTFLQKNVRVSNDVYLEMLITHLSGKNKNHEDYSELLKSQSVLLWIEKAVGLWEQNECPDHHIAAFTLRLLALLVQNEWQFAVIKEKQIIDRIQTSLKIHTKLQTPSIQVANVILLTAVSKHSIGLHWIKQAKIWQIVLEYCQNNQTNYVVRESLIFIQTTLNKFSTLINDDELCLEILTEICKPLTESVKFMTDLNNVVAVDDTDVQRKVTPTLNTISYLLKKSIESTNSERSKISYHIVQTFKLDCKLWRLANTTHDHLFLGKILRAFVLGNFVKLQIQSEGSKDEIDFNVFGVNFFNYMNFCISRCSSVNIIMMAELNHTLWKTLEPRASQEVILENQRIKFEDQLIMLQILPILFMIKKRQTEETECMDNYVMKLFNISAEHTIRLAYTFRDLLSTHPDDKVADLACKSIQGILLMKNALHRDRAVIVVQALVYTLQEFEPENNCFHDRPKITATDLLLKTPNLLSAILTGLHDLIKNYRITWKECIESTILVNFMLTLLGNPNLSCIHAVQALKLTQLSIEHFLAPNLALLVDTLHGSGMETLGPMIFKRLHDNAWEIRDSTLELLTSMVAISEMKFTAYQQHILENGICPIVGTMAKNDCEPYVRASALSCLRQMVNVKLFWERSLCNLDLLSHLILLLGTESEGIVKKEAVALISGIYEQQKVPKSDLDNLFSTMAHCAVNDLHWEVKTNALHFWKIVMCRQFQHQGMIDGTFPAVTFSKEHKKIVTLDNKEISLRLSKVLNELSLRGCLGVILKCLDDDCDLEVVKVSVAIVQILVAFLNKYNYNETRQVNEKIGNETKEENSRGLFDCKFIKEKQAIKTTERNNADVCSQSIKRSVDIDSIIDSIVSATDVNLLVTAYENQMQVETIVAKSKIDPNLFQQFAKVTPEDFLNHIYKIDLENLVKTKSDWISHTESLNSLLDDVILSFKDLEFHDADCY